MRLFNFLKGKTEQLTVEKIKDFLRYSEVSGILGREKPNRIDTPLGWEIRMDSTRENSKWVYKGIWIFGGKKWAYISIENENIKFRYIETDYWPSIEDCPITTNKKTISLITKTLLGWYRELKLPNAISEIQKRIDEHVPVSVVKEVKFNAFGDEAVLRILSDGTTYLLINMFPPENIKLTKYQEDNFEKLLAKAINKKVIHEDRELFVIFDNSQKMIDDVILFLQSFPCSE